MDWNYSSTHGGSHLCQGMLAVQKIHENKFDESKEIYYSKAYRYSFYCEDCRGRGCEGCDSGIVSYYFNSEPNEPNVIGIENRMVNDRD